MASKKRQRKRQVERMGGTCVFCGMPANTIDHVPPQGIFAPPRIGLIEVPACKQCNGGASTDDEYLQRLSLAWGAERSRDAQFVGAAVQRAIERPEARGLRRGFLRTLSPADLYVPAATATGYLWAGRSFRMEFDNARLERIIRKVVRGLHFHVTGRLLSIEYGVQVHPVGAAPAGSPIRANEQHILDQPATVIGDQAFTFRCSLCEQDGNLSLWRVSFYGVLEYMGYTFREVGTQRVVMLLTDATSEQVAAAVPAESHATAVGFGTTSRVLTYVPGPRPGAAAPPA